MSRELANKLKQKFRLRTEFTKIYDDLDAAETKFFDDNVKLLDGEIPILAYFEAGYSWFLLTTFRVIWVNPDNEVYELNLDEISTVKVTNGPERWRKKPLDPRIFTPEEQERAVRYCPWIIFSDVFGRTFEAFPEEEAVAQIRHLIWHMSSGGKKAYETAKEELEKAKAITPPTGSDAYRVFRMKRDILKHGDAYSEWFFEKLGTGVQQLLLNAVALDDQELPAYAFFESEETWLLTTSRRVAWSRPGYKHQLRYGQIGNAGLSEIVRIQKGDPESKSKEICRIKGSSPWFFLEDEHGVRHDALLPPGAPLLAVWNSIRFMQRLDLKHPIANEA